jgi:hypothetical protein
MTPTTFQERFAELGENRERFLEAVEYVRDDGRR